MGGLPRRLAELSRPESLRLLTSAPHGRIVYTVRALPAIVPARHLVTDDGMVVVRTHVAAECVGSVVAYEADLINGDAWTVTVTGVARRVADADELIRYETELTPLVSAPGIEVIRIFPEIVAGFRLG